MTKAQQRKLHLDRLQQRFKLEDRIAWLSDHITRLENVRSFSPVVAAWRRELLEKRRLKMELSIGLPLSNSEIERGTEVLRLLSVNGARPRAEFINMPLNLTIIEKGSRETR